MKTQEEIGRLQWLKQYLAVLTPFAIIVTVAAFSHYYTTSRTARVEQESNELLNVGLARSTLNRDIAQVISDLLFLASYFQPEGLETSGKSCTRETLQLFFTFAREKRLYDQVRFIDSRGRERVRVNYRDGNPQLVAENQLQDKSGRYYFTETMRLDAGEIYISPLDLNIELGRIEQPHKPMLRFATPVYDALGKKHGILVLNYLGDRLLQEFNRAAANIGDHIHLLNQEGYWLSSPDENKVWGFMLSHGQSFAKHFPRAWREITNSVSGQLKTKQGLITYETVTPWRVAAQTFGARGMQLPKPVYARHWKVVALLPTDRLDPGLARFIGRHLPLYLVILVTLLFGSWLLARAQVRHRRAESQREYEQHFRRTLEDMQLAAVTIDRNYQLIFCNDYFLQLGGWQREEILGCSWLNRFVAEEQQQQARDSFQAIFAGAAGDQHVAIEIQRDDGGRRLIAWHNTPFLDADGTMVGITAIGEDVTGRKQAEEKVRKLSYAVEQSPSIVMLTDRRGCIEYVNPKFCEVTGYRPDEVIGRQPSVLKSGETPSDEYARLWQTIRTGGEWRGEFHNRRKSGELYWESAAISALRSPDGEITNYVAVKEDISEHKRLQAEIEQRNRELANAQSLAAMGRMASMIAHDLRNPLSSVKMGIQILGKQAPGDQKELMTIGLSQIHYMEEILSDMLAFARPEALKTEWVNLDKVLDATVNGLQRHITETGVQLTLDYQAGLPVVPGDANKLRQLFSNLISNALQSTESRPDAREVSIQAGWQLGGQGTEVKVSVCDNGKGLGECDRDKLFEPFYTTRSKGTGLGLAIVSQIVQQHGGEVGISDRKNTGACAWVMLPTTPPASSEGVIPPAD